MHPQLPLSFDADGAKTFESFHPGSNRAVWHNLQSFAAAEAPDLQYLIWGETGVGKTHLLNACCHQAASLGFRIAYIPVSLVNGADVFEGLADCDLVCIDDIDLLPQQKDIELGLFALFNALRARDARLLVASACATDALSLQLPDLRTRLGWGVTYKLQELSADDVRQSLEQQAIAAGLLLEGNVVDYLMNHFPRDIDSQTRNLKLLDRASMQAQRKITIPLVREVLLQPVDSV